MQTNMYNDYDNEIFDYYTTSTFDNRTRNYLISRYTPDATWSYGDSVSITFNIKELSNISNDDIGDKFIKVNFYNFRYEEIPFDYQEQGSLSLTVSIDYDTSIKYFKRGIYHCSLKLIEYNKEDSAKIESMETLLSMNDCSLYVD